MHFNHDSQNSFSVYVHHGSRTIACVAWRFWLGALSNKGGRGEGNREEIANFAAWPLVRPARQNRHATQATRTKKRVDHGVTK